MHFTEHKGANLIIYWTPDAPGYAQNKIVVTAKPPCDSLMGLFSTETPSRAEEGKNGHETRLSASALLCNVRL
jgi:hypothetical protein